MRLVQLCLATVVTTALAASDARADMSVEGKLTEVVGTQYGLMFYVSENGTNQRYYAGVTTCTAVGVNRLDPAAEHLLIEAFKNDWKVRVEWKASNNGSRCAQGIYVKK
jgi:hypothetical protein